MVAPLVGLAVGAAARAVAKKAAQTAVKKTIKKTTKRTAKRTAAERGFAKDKASRKEMKKQDIFYNKAGKADLKEGNRSGAAIANTPKSQSPSKPKVSVKKTSNKKK